MKPEVHDEVVMNRVRTLVGELLRDDVPPIVIAYALAYAAAEFGLRAEKDARRVLPTLLGAMAGATADAMTSELDKQDETPGEARLRGATSH